MLFSFLEITKRAVSELEREFLIQNKVAGREGRQTGRGELWVGGKNVEIVIVIDYILLLSS